MTYYGDHPPLDPAWSYVDPPVQPRPVTVELTELEARLVLTTLDGLWKSIDDLRRFYLPPFDEPLLEKQHNVEAVMEQIRSKL